MLSSSPQSIFCRNRWLQWCNALPKGISLAFHAFSPATAKLVGFSRNARYSGLNIGVGIGIGVAIASSLFSVYSKSWSLGIFSPLPPSTPLASAILPSEPVIPYQAGTLRVRNQTYHPIRVALLPRINETSSIANLPVELANTSDTPDSTSFMVEDIALARTAQTQYGEPIHWDFVPREGHEEGLVLAVPDGQFWVQSGDIVTAFAQDGSRRYWGPYVIGVTDTPVWDEQRGEWLLILETPFPF
ncbi:MAG: hypothetical protein VKJ64_06215 [Leptolyngbyaceae bacterium]|nr:hypothetical protein [Leptolyngbyaceae bacterium]